MNTPAYFEPTAQALTFLIDELRVAGFADPDIAWAEALQPPTDADEFAREIIFVICNSGMRFTVARQIYDRCCAALHAGEPVSTVFGHHGKAAAIERTWTDRRSLLARYLAAPDKLEFLGALPWIGPTTKFHCAKNFGLELAKPDVHLQRLADRCNVTAQALCEHLARDTGYRVTTVDTLLWRACAIGILDSKTGRLYQAHAEARSSPAETLDAQQQELAL